MENALLIITICSLALNAILVVSILIFLFKTMKYQRNLKDSETEPQLINQVENKPKADLAPRGYCIDHLSVVSVGNCSISGESFCEHCLKQFGNHKIGKRHLHIYLNAEWLEFLSLPIDDEAELNKQILELKSHLWNEKQTPVIIERHYKIDVAEDEVEVFTILKGKKEELEDIKPFFVHLLNQN